MDYVLHTEEVFVKNSYKQEKKNKKQGVSLIVLVITITSTYDEANKIYKIPPKIINESKVVSCKLTTFNNIHDMI